MRSAMKVMVRAGNTIHVAQMIWSRLDDPTITAILFYCSIPCQRARWRMIR